MKIHCTNKNHKDENPSMEVYPDGGYCFVCNHYDPEVGNEEIVREKENIEESLRQIKASPKINIRGLECHSSDDGFYIIWPSGDFFKKRVFTGSDRYRAPRGHKPPLFIYPGIKERLVLVEGELNCMSLKLAYPDCKATLASPGSASNMLTYIDSILTYSNITVIVDKDPAGVINGINLKNVLINHKKKVQLVALENDFNSILVKNGIIGIKETCQKEGVDLQ